MAGDRRAGIARCVARSERVMDCRFGDYTFVDANVRMTRRVNRTMIYRTRARPPNNRANATTLKARGLILRRESRKFTRAKGLLRNRVDLSRPPP